MDALTKDVMIPRPLEQQVMVGRGFFDLKFTQKKTMSIGDYKKLVDADNKMTRGKSTEEIEKQVN